MKNRSYIALFLLLLLVTASCASRKKAIVLPQPQTFEWLTANLDIDAEDNHTSFNGLTGQLRMRKDSVIWLSVTATFGVEVLRAKITTDSVWVLNRLGKNYLAEPLDELAEPLDLPLSLPWAQALLFDNNEGLPPVENQTVQLKTLAFGNMSARIKYTNVKLNEKTSFPLKISDKMERFRLQKKKGS